MTTYDGSKTVAGGTSGVSTAGGILSGLSSIANVGVGIANYFQQQKQYKWEQMVQQMSWAREDNAVQRRVNDLKAAGLSPVLAAGSAANAGPVVQTHAPQMSQVPDMSQSVKTAIDLLSQEKQIAQTAQQTELIKDQQSKTLSDIEVNAYNKLRMQSEINLNNARVTGQLHDNRIKKVDADNSELSGVGHDSSLPGKMYKDLTGSVTQQLRNAETSYNQLKGAASEIVKKLRPDKSQVQPNQAYFYNDKTKKWEKRK